MRSWRGLQLLGLFEIRLGRLSPCSGGWRQGGEGDLTGGVFLCIGRKLSSQAKVIGAHGVDSWVSVPHGRKYLSHGADVLLHISFVGRLLVGHNDACTDLVSEDL